MSKVKVGVIGCGKISDIYLTNITGMHSDILEIAAISDLNLSVAKTRAEQYSIPDILSVDEFYKSDKYDIVINLTIPKAHYSVCKEALLNGKHVYTEKPLSIKYSESVELMELAKSKGLVIAGSPDTFMGASAQTARKAIDDGLIGEPVAATAFMLCHGWEQFHPNPDFYYAKGGGPMFDMGPYYLTALINLLGPAKEVCGMYSNPIKHREIVVGPRKGEALPIEIPTHVAGNILFKNGVIATVITTFDVWPTEMPHILIYGTKGTLIVPNPDHFGDPVKLRIGDNERLIDLPLLNKYNVNSRGIGICDMALAIKEKRMARTDSKMASHVLEIMEAFHRSQTEKKHIQLRSECVQPAPFYGKI